jgi:DNA-binding PadR family transcriptional regulator
MKKDDLHNDIMREFLLGFIKIHILHHAGQERIYGKEFHEELNRHGYNVSFGTIYPVFHKLEKSGYLVSEKEKVNGRIRKYYSITNKGKSALNSTRKMAEELFREITE